eukprot:Tbor_TRINITY_DN6024_c2_g1::TRINITY_DN6024_c2_g1_i7::g.10423::m.10423/K02734/PSMB2; 20S proteasome subunit beta 4
MSDTIIGIKFQDFVLLTSSGLCSHYYIKISDTEDKSIQLDKYKVLLCSGADGPRKNFQDYIKCNYKLNNIRQHGRINNCVSTVGYIRNELARAIRSRDGAYEVNSIFAGVDVPEEMYNNNNNNNNNNNADGGGNGNEDDNDNNNNNNKLNNNKPKTYLYWLDYLGCSQSVPYGAHGYGATFIISILDRYYNNNMTPQEAIDLLQKCIDEVKKRVIISTPHFISRVITRDGVQLLEHCH